MKNLIIAILTLTMVACGAGADKEGILQPEEFEKMMYEIHIADALLKHKNMSDRKLKKFNESYYNHIFLKYNISPSGFERNVRHYSEKTEEYQKMYKRVLNRLEDAKDSLERVDTIIRESKINNQTEIR